MTWEQYWYGDAWMVEAFLEADRLRRERQNSFAHLQGMYIYEALGDVSPLLHAFAKKGTKALPYPDKPYALEGEPELTKEEQEAQDDKDRAIALLYMSNMIRAGAEWGKNNTQGGD